MVLWDTAGDEALYRVPTSFFIGSSGTLLVVDGTRTETLKTGLEIRERAVHAGDESQWVCLLNKSDLDAEWALDALAEAELAATHMPVFRTSAKSGSNVDVAFRELGRRISEGCFNSKMP
jgi:GTPase SAR1 family protein